MPLPVIHSYVGYKIYKASLSDEQKKNWRIAAFVMLIANLPDLDMIPGMIFGNPEAFHRSITHSLFGAFICSMLVSSCVFLVSRFKPKAEGLGSHVSGRVSRVFLLTFFAYGSHLILDGFTGQLKYIFWPIRLPETVWHKPFIIQQVQNALPCGPLNQLCHLLFASTLLVRLSTEGLGVWAVQKMIYAISRTRASVSRPGGFRHTMRRLLPSGVSESPLLVAGLTVFLFVLTALILTEVAG